MHTHATNRNGAVDQRTRKKILIVEDDEDTRHALELRLTASGYDTVVAGDGVMAMVGAGIARPDLIILDLGLPKADGISVLKELHLHPPLRDIPVVIITGREVELNREQAFKHGARAFLQKPVDNEHLLSVIHGFITNSSGEQG